MPHLSLYLLREDILFVNDWLNAEEEIAFLVSVGEGRWVARREHAIVPDIGTQRFGGSGIWPGAAEYYLWHIPSGPLPLPRPTGSTGVKLRIRPGTSEEELHVRDPWGGWNEMRAGANRRIPWLGPGPVGAVHLTIHEHENEEIPLSGFGWIGNHYRIIGNAAPAVTMKFWKRLRGMAKKVGSAIPRGNRTGLPSDSYAFPHAHREIMNGRPCAIN